MRLQIRLGHTFCVCGFLIICTSYAHAGLILPRVRPVDRRMHALVSRGYAESGTIAALVDALQRSDIIVHIEAHALPSDRILGATQFVTAAGGQRYLRIWIDPRIPDEATISMIGHELYHAWEIAQAPWVVNQETLARLYADIGHRSGSGHRWRGVDTAQANETERRVRADLRAFSPRHWGAATD